MLKGKGGELQFKNFQTFPLTTKVCLTILIPMAHEVQAEPMLTSLWQDNTLPLVSADLDTSHPVSTFILTWVSATSRKLTRLHSCPLSTRGEPQTMHRVTVRGQAPRCNAFIESCQQGKKQHGKAKPGIPSGWRREGQARRALNILSKART